MDYFTPSDIRTLMEKYLAETFGKEVSFHQVDPSQILVLVNDKTSNRALTAFRRLMIYFEDCRNSPVWKTSPQHIPESAFENSLVGNGLPLRTLKHQKREITQRPPSGRDLMSFSEETEYQSAVMWGKIFEAARSRLSDRKGKDFIVNEEPIVDPSQKTLSSKNGSRNGNGSLAHYPTMTRKLRDSSRIKTYFDAVFEPGIHAEIKPRSHIRDKFIRNLGAQLDVYDIACSMNGERKLGKKVPFLVVQPTLASYRERDLGLEFSARTKRGLVYVGVTTSRYLAYDLSMRYGSPDSIEKQRGKGTNIPLEVLRNHLAEKNHVSKLVAKIEPFVKVSL